MCLTKIKKMEEAGEGDLPQWRKQRIHSRAREPRQEKRREAAKQQRREKCTVAEDQYWTTALILLLQQSLCQIYAI